MQGEKPFSYRVKQELGSLNNLKNKNLVKFELEGYLLPNSSNQILTENEYNIGRFSKLLSNVGIDDFDIEMKGDNFCIVLKNFKDICKKYDVTKEPNLQEEEVRALFRGVFLRAGSINNPDNIYHLEIIFDNVQKGKFFIELAKKYDLDFGSSKRNSGLMMYLKNGDSISKFIAFIGANGSVLEFEQTRVVKDIRNNINRQVNLETANLNKTISSAVKQINDIKYIKQKNKFNELSDKERQLANLRIENPDKTLTELGQMILPNMSKSGVNHRLQNISEFADELRRNE